MKGKACDLSYCLWCRRNLEELKVELEETMTRPHERERLGALRLSSRVKRVKRVEELGREDEPDQVLARASDWREFTARKHIHAWPLAFMSISDILK